MFRNKDAPYQLSIMDPNWVDSKRFGQLILRFELRIAISSEAVFALLLDIYKCECRVIIKEKNRNITFNIVLNSNIVYYVLVVDFFIPSRIIN